VLRSIDGMTPELLSWYARQVEGGAFFAVGFFDRARLVCVALTEEQSGPRGRELMVVASAGGVRGVDLTATVLGHLEAMARADGYRAIRFETRRQGLVRRTVLLGYTFGRVVMEKELGPCA
jgi:hypothetical protein